MILLRDLPTSPLDEAAEEVVAGEVPRLPSYPACPHCHSDTVKRNSVFIRWDGLLLRRMRCGNCWRTWVDAKSAA